MVEEFDHSEGYALRLLPNRSLSWHGNLIIFFILAFFALVIAVAWSLAGAWLILPFAGLEIAFLAYALYYTSRQCHRQEVLIFSADNLRLEKGFQRKETEWDMPRKWVRLVVTPARHGFALPGLMLAYRDTEVPVAEFLNGDERNQLIELLEREGITVERQGNAGIWWF